MVIDENSTPVYNYSHLANLFSSSAKAIWTDEVTGNPVWTCADWMAFYKALTGKLGEAAGKDKWSNWWLMGVDTTSGGLGDERAGSGWAYSSVPDDCKVTDSDFIAFVNKNNLRDVVYKGVGGAVAKPISAGTTILSNVEDSITTTSKIIKYGVPILLVTAATLLIIYGVRKAQHA